MNTEKDITKGILKDDWLDMILMTTNAYLKVSVIGLQQIFLLQLHKLTKFNSLRGKAHRFDE